MKLISDFLNSNTDQKQNLMVFVGFLEDFLPNNLSFWRKFRTKDEILWFFRLISDFMNSIIEFDGFWRIFYNIWSVLKSNLESITPLFRIQMFFYKL